MKERTTNDLEPVRRHFDISAANEPQLELRLHWFGRALALRQGYILDVQRRRSRAGKHVASIAYEVPLPRFGRGGRAVTARPRVAVDVASGTATA